MANNVGFKLGTQSALDALIAKGASAGAAPGSFYLTSDTHRLYIGNDDTSVTPVNEGVVTVANVSSLPTITTANKAAYAGRFYYATAENILCIFNGQNWVQLNPDTSVSGIEFFVIKMEGNEIRVNNIIYNTVNKNTTQIESDYLDFKGENGVVLDVTTTQVGGVDCHTITIKGDVYTVSAEKNGNNANLKLTSEQGYDSNVQFVPGNASGETKSNVTFEVDADGNIVIAAKDSKNASMSVDDARGFTISLKDNHNHTVQTMLEPKIKYGDKEETVEFLNGVATLDVYSKSDIAETLKALNAMTYRGTAGSGGSAATSVSYDLTTKVTSIKLNGVDVQCSIGDTFMICSDGMTVNGIDRLSIGSLIIAKGTEGANGYITAATLAFDAVESTVDTDTTYHFVSESVTNGGGVALVNHNTEEAGVLQIVGKSDTHITIEKTSTSIGGGKKGVIEKLTIKHGDVAREDTTEKTVSMSYMNVGGLTNWGSKVTVPVVTAVETDATGHVTGIKVTPHLIENKSGYLSSPSHSTSAYTKSGKTVGIVTHEMGFTAPSGSEMTVNSSVAFSSSSLTITNDDTNTTTETGTTKAQGLNIELVWGSFS